MGEETDGFSWHIATVKQLVVQFYEIVLRIIYAIGGLLNLQNTLSMAL